MKRFVQLCGVVAFTILILSPLAFAGGSRETVSENRLVFWKHHHEPADRFLENIIADFQAENPDVEIVVESIPHGEYITKLLTSIAGGEGPDLFDLGDTDVPGFMARNIMAPIDYAALGFPSQAAFEAEWLPTTLDSFTDAQGRRYGYPIEYNSWQLVINTEHFREAGLDPERDYPRTWEDVVRIGRALTRYDDSGNITRSGFILPFPHHSGWYLFNFEPHLLQRGGLILNEEMTESFVNSPEGVAVAQYWHDLVYTHRITHPDAASASADANQDFGEGRASMWITGPWAVPVLQNYGVPFKVVSLPQHDPANPVHITSSWAWFVNRSSRNQELAWRFIEFASKYQEEWLTEVGYILPRIGWFESEAAQTLDGLDVFLDGMSYGRPRVRTLNYAEVANVMQRHLQRVVLQGVSPEQAMNDAKVEIDRVVRD